jgi:PII-like signaling protein
VTLDGKMLSTGAAVKVIIHLNEDTSAGSDFLYAEIFQFLYSHGVSGATLLRPHASFGAHHRIHTAGAGLTAGEHLPVRIEFLEMADVAERLLPELCELVTDGVIESHPTTIVKAAAERQTL